MISFDDGHQGRDPGKCRTIATPPQTTTRCCTIIVQDALKIDTCSHPVSLTATLPFPAHPVWRASTSLPLAYQPCSLFRGLLSLISTRSLPSSAMTPLSHEGYARASSSLVIVVFGFLDSIPFVDRHFS